MLRILFGMFSVIGAATPAAGRSRRTPRRAVAALAALVALAGCSDPVAGTAASGYRPPAIDQVTLTPTDPPAPAGGRVVGISADGTRTVTMSKDGICSSSGNGPQVCAQLPAKTGATVAVLSPAGDRYVVFVDPRIGGYLAGNQAWIVDAATGKPTEIQLPDRQPAGPAPSGPTGGSPGSATAPSTPSPTTVGATTSSGAADSLEPVLTFRWAGNDLVYGILLKGGVAQIDPATGIGKQLTQGTSDPEDVVDQAVLVGSTLVTLRRVAPRDTRLVAVTLPAGTPLGPQVRLGEGQPMLLGASPDGTKALVSMTDVARFLPGEMSVVDLAAGTRKAVPGTAEAFTFAGGFSPDGSLIALVTASKEKDSSLPSGFSLSLAPADGSAAPRSVGDPGKAKAYGPLRWNTRNQLCTDGSLLPDIACWTLQ